MSNAVIADNGVEIYTHEIYECVDKYMTINCIDDLSTVSQSKWNDVLLFIYDNVFRNTDKLKVLNNINNAYDIKKLNEVFEIYIRLCYKHEKEISQNGFCKLTGVTKETLTSWSRDVNKLGSPGSDLHKKIAEENEESIVCLLESGKRNPMCYMPILNHRHGWNMPGVNNGTVEQRQSIEEIQARYSVGHAENPLIEPPKADF